MTTRLWLFFWFHSIAWVLGGWAFKEWVDRPGGYRWKSDVGLAMCCGCVFTLAMPFLGRCLGWRGSSSHPAQWGSGAFLCLAALVAGSGLIRIFSLWKYLASLGACPSEGDPHTPRTALRDLGKVKSQLASIQKSVGRRNARPVAVCPTELLARPTLVGVFACRIYMPIEWVAAGQDARSAIERLSDVASQNRYQAYAIFWWISQLYPVLRVVTNSVKRAMETGMEGDAEPASMEPGLHCRGAASFMSMFGSSTPLGLSVSKPARANSLSHRRPLAFLPVLGLTGLCGWGAWASGGLDPQLFSSLLVKRQIVGFSTHAYDPSVQFRPLPGKGGILPDGVMVDTRNDSGVAGCSTVRLPLGLIQSEVHIPFGAEAITVGIEWEVIERRECAREMPALKITCSEQVKDPDGQRKLNAFYTRNIVLPEKDSGHGSLAVTLRLHPVHRLFKESTDVIYGPVIYVPRGWMIGFSNYSLSSASLHEVPKVPADEAGTFVAWYLRNGGRGALPDLRWGDEADCRLQL